jgi:hypothetical protein
MELVINKIKMYGDEKEIITINDKGIFYETNDSYKRTLSENNDIIEALLSRFFSITYTWKQEYLGPRSVDGYKYLITMDVNHKRKSYKIQNKYPDNWQEFIDLKDSITDGGYLK